jgi:hypothetical protein
MSIAGQIEIMLRVRWAPVLCLAMAALMLLPASVSLTGATSNLLLSSGDFSYQGSFRLPSGTFGNPPDTFEYAGGFVSGNVYNDPVNGKTLFISGYKSGLMVSNAVSIAQVKIPSTLADPSLVGVGGLPAATTVQGFADPSNGIGTNALAGLAGFGSFVAYGGKLIGTEAVAYDGIGQQTKSAWVAPLDFSKASQATGPYALSEPINPRIIGGGFMTMIPPEWQAAFGGKIVSGNGPTSIIAQGTAGPSLHVIDADTLITQPSTSTVIQSTPLVYYPCPSGDTTDQVNCHMTLGSWSSNLPNQGWNGRPVPTITVVDPHGRGTFTIPYNDNSSRIEGVLFADGTSSVVFFGHKGLGPYCYGLGSACGDLDSAPDSKGDHAYPYTEFAWFYDVNDLLDVKNRRKNPWDVYPYTGWAFKVFGDKNGGYPVGVAWDPANRLAYFVVPYTTDVAAPIVNVYKVGAGTARPTPPTLHLLR